VLWCWVGLWIPSHSRLCINGPSEPGCLTGGCVRQWVKLGATLVASFRPKLLHPQAEPPPNTHWISRWWVPELVWMLWGRVKPLTPDRNQTFDYPFVQAITYSLYQLSYPGTWDTLQGFSRFSVPKVMQLRNQVFGTRCSVTGWVVADNLMELGDFISMGQAAAWR